MLTNHDVKRNENVSNITLLQGPVLLILLFGRKAYTPIIRIVRKVKPE